MKLSGSTALVTGAASGLGAATARALADRGVDVIGLDLTAPVVEPVETTTPHIRYITADVTDEAAVADALAQVDPATPLRLVVNCAGIAPAVRLLSSKGVHDLATFRRAVDVNLVGTFNVLRLAAEVMAQNEPIDADGQRGLIVNTASVAAYDGQIGQVAYSASKGAIVGMTLPAARDLARNGIRVNTIAPGIVRTPLLAGLGEKVVDSLSATVPFPARLARPDEYAQLVVMLAEHDYLNGETIRMDGALRMAPQ
jgi:NAD(P)-dependent dehydrogenase (short-subunit alcohol dehydrogenase family)